jgi:hypothetical protein
MFEFSHRLRIVSLVLGAAVFVTFASTGCVTHHHRSYGTSVHTVTAPPRSAAHGYAHHYRDVVLVFDGSWNGYWVRSRPHHYFHSNHYYRMHGGRWQRARHIRGPWGSVELRALPAGLHHRETVKPRRSEHRGAARERREVRREVAKVKREEPRKVAKVRREVPREVKREVRREVPREVKREVRREVPREVKREVKREVRREVPREVKREVRREVAKVKREEPRKVAKVKREEPRKVAKVKREEPRKVAKVKREEPREVAESRKTRQVAASTAGASRGSAKHRGRKVRKDEDEEFPANRRVE